MIAKADAKTNVDQDQWQLVTFYLGDTLLGVDIQHVREINRIAEITPVPHLAAAIRGVINLRGDVVTILDLRTVLGLPAHERQPAGRILIVNWEQELIGLLVDRVADVITTRAREVDPRPENLNSIEARFYHGVHKLERGLLVVLNVRDVIESLLIEGSH